MEADLLLALPALKNRRYATSIPAYYDHLKDQMDVLRIIVLNTILKMAIAEGVDPMGPILKGSAAVPPRRPWPRPRRRRRRLKTTVAGR